MAKRREAHDEELPFVALMDTMTNVVGVLIIVLVMIAISLADSMKKIFSELPPVTVEELQKVLQKLQDSTPKVDPKEIEKQISDLEKQIKFINEELKTLDVTMEKSGIKNIDLDSLKKQLADRTKARNDKKILIEKLFAEIDRLKALLSEIPVYTPEPATVVKLPNPRPLPEKAVIQRFMVANNRVTYMNEEGFVKAVVAEIEKNKKNLTHPNPVKNAFGEVITVKDRGKDVPKEFLDRQRVINHFQTRTRLSTKDVLMEIVGTPNSPRLSIRLTPSPNGGDAKDAFNNPASVFQRAMRKFESEKDQVVWFNIYRDSLVTYLAARDVADAIKVPVGWEIQSNPYIDIPIPGVEVDYKAVPPPRPNPNAINIPRAKQGLD